MIVCVDLVWYLTHFRPRIKIKLFHNGDTFKNIILYNCVVKNNDGVNIFGSVTCKLTSFMNQEAQFKV